MSLVKKNRMDHFRKNKKNVKRRAKEKTERQRRLSEHGRALAAAESKAKSTAAHAKS